MPDFATLLQQGAARAGAGAFQDDVHHAERRWSSTMTLIARRAPYVSSALIILVGLHVGFQGLRGLSYTLAGIGGSYVS